MSNYDEQTATASEPPHTESVLKNAFSAPVGGS